jgi:hypothetical protein
MANDIEVIFSGQEAIDVTVDLSTISGSLRIFNTDESFDQTITEDTELSDITVGDSLTSPSNVNVGVDDWDKMVSVAGGIGYNYPFATGQEEIYLTGDDAWVETNIFTAAVRLANGLKPKNWLAVGSFTTLVNNNAFGNLNRFTDDQGNQNYDGTLGSTNNYAIDHMTGIGWYLVVQTGAWTSQIPAAVALTVGAYSNFFIPDIEKLYTIINKSSTNGYNYSPFNKNGTPILIGWLTSTTWPQTTTSILVCTINGQITNLSKGSGLNRAFYCRKHY